MASCGSTAQRGLCPPVSLQPSAGYVLLWLSSPVQAMASCGSAAQRGLWPPVALQPSAGYGLLWFCSPARAMASCGSTAQRGLWPPHPRGFLITHNDASQSVGLLWTRHQLVAETSTWQHTTQTTDKHPCPPWDSNHDRSRRATVDLRLRSRGHWDRRLCFTTVFQLLLNQYFALSISPFGAQLQNMISCGLLTL
jgi:hypothetical protein